MYGKNWDQYYIRTYREGKKKALWDVPPEEAVARDFANFREHLPPDRPIIDLGCGTGTQSDFLAQHYPRVLGVDVAPEAIRMAESQFSRPNLRFDVFDTTDTEKAREIAAAYAPAHVYMRGVLHQILDEHLDQFRAAISSLLGEEGHLYLVEVSDQIRDHFRNTTGRFSELPTRLRQVFISNLPPRGLSLEKLPHYFPKSEFRILQAGEARLETNLHIPGGEAIFIPAVSAIVKNIANNK